MLGAAVMMISVAAQPADEFPWRLDRAVDPGYADTGGLVDSFRIPMTDLRESDGWDKVFEMDSAFGPIYARRNGALTAVFPHSDYVDSGNGSVPVVPPGTVFVIGEPAPWLLRQLGLDDGLAELNPPGRLDMTFDLPPVQRDLESEAVALEQARRAVSMWFNEDVRARRVNALLSEAAAAADD